jgi:hypothetical protein
MAAGAKPALDALADGTNEAKNEAVQPTEAKPVTLKDRIIHKLTEIFEYNERLGSTRQ